jgi:hypothetical protein
MQKPISPPPSTIAATAQSTSVTVDPAEAEFEAHLSVIEVIWKYAQTKHRLSKLIFSSRALRTRLGKKPVLS